MPRTVDHDDDAAGIELVNKASGDLAREAFLQLERVERQQRRPQCRGRDTGDLARCRSMVSRGDDRRRDGNRYV
jgi:hypothetical protein